MAKINHIEYQVRIYPDKMKKYRDLDEIMELLQGKTRVSTLVLLKESDNEDYARIAYEDMKSRYGDDVVAYYKDGLVAMNGYRHLPKLQDESIEMIVVSAFE